MNLNLADHGPRRNPRQVVSLGLIITVIALGSGCVTQMPLAMDLKVRGGAPFTINKNICVVWEKDILDQVVIGKGNGDRYPFEIGKALVSNTRSMLEQIYNDVSICYSNLSCADPNSDVLEVKLEGFAFKAALLRGKTSTVILRISYKYRDSSGHEFFSGRAKSDGPLKVEDFDNGLPELSLSRALLPNTIAPQAPLMQHVNMGLMGAMIEAKHRELLFQDMVNQAVIQCLGAILNSIESN